MSLAKRVSLIILFTLSALLGGVTIFVDEFVTKEFRQFDNTSMELNLHQVRRAFENVENQISAKVVDWAQWDNTYEFIADGNDSYVHENLNFLTLNALQLKHLGYFDSTGTLIHSYEVFEREERVTDIPKSTQELLKGVKLALKASDSPVTGLLKLDGTLVVYASSPILDTNREKESRGSLVFTRVVNSALFASIAKQTNLTFTALRLDIDPLGSVEKKALEILRKGQENYILNLDNTLMQGYGLLKDTKGEPALLVRVDNPRTNYIEGLNVSKIMKVSLIIAGVLWAVLTLLLLNLWILRPISLLSSEVNKIAQSKDSSLTVAKLHEGSSLRLRAVAIISITMLLLTGGLSYTVSSLFNKEFAAIEESQLIDDIHRVERALTERRENLLSKTVDWGQWDDSYQFIADQNEEYPTANITYDTLGAIGMSHVLFFDKEANFVTGWVLDVAREEAIRLTKEQSDITTPFADYVKGQTEASTGFVSQGTKSYLVAQSPILNSERTSSSRGYFLFAMPMHDEFIKGLAVQTELNLAKSTPEERSKFANEITYPGNITIGVVGDKSIVGVVPALKDSKGHEALTLQITRSRDVYEKGLESQYALIVWLLGASIIFVSVTLFALQRWVISKVFALKRGLLSLPGTTDGKNNFDQKDELSMLSSNINGMLNSLNEAQAEIVKARDAAEAANNAKSSFIAKVSHELRTPIHGIIGMLRIVLKQETNPSRRSHLGMARDAAYALLSTINDILDFSKAEAGMLSVNPVPFDVKHSVRGALRTVAPRVYERDGLEILCEYDSSIPTELIGDPVRLKQVLVNLLGNSAKFTNAGFVKLLVRKDGLDNGKCLLHIEISDTGIGIPEDRLPTIFDPFTQADNSAARKYQGTGLGLTIVKQLVEAMGGTITVQSKINVGSCFTIILPLEISKAEANSSFSSINPVIGKDVIIIDHCAERRESFQQYLLGVGATSVRFDPVGTTSRNTVVIATGECLLMPEYRDFLIEFGKSFGYSNVVTLHTPNQLSLREELHAQGVRLMLTRPVLSSDVVEALRGDIEAEIKSEESDDSAPTQVTKRRRVLIADDTPTNLIILRDLLEERGFEVTSVTNGQEILTSVNEYLSSGAEAPFDIILSDVQMPQMDGVTATKLIREKEQNHTGCHIPVVMVTAHAFPEEKQRLLEAGADGVVTKPIEPEELGKILALTLS